nr:hypothetical protein [Pseudomonas fluorescens]
MRKTEKKRYQTHGLARVLDGDTLNQALIKADAALYESKHTRKDRYTFHQ